MAVCVGLREVWTGGLPLPSLRFDIQTLPVCPSHVPVLPTCCCLVPETQSLSCTQIWFWFHGLIPSPGGQSRDLVSPRLGNGARIPVCTGSAASSVPTGTMGTARTDRSKECRDTSCNPCATLGFLIILKWHTFTSGTLGLGSLILGHSFPTLCESIPISLR